MNDALRKCLGETVQKILRGVDGKCIGRPRTGPGQSIRYRRQRSRDSVDILFGGAERNNREIAVAGDLDIEIRAIAAAIDEQPTVEIAAAGIENQRELLRQPAIKNRIGPSLARAPCAWDR